MVIAAILTLVFGLALWGLADISPNEPRRPNPQVTTTTTTRQTIPLPTIPPTLPPSASPNRDYSGGSSQYDRYMDDQYDSYIDDQYDSYMDDLRDSYSDFDDYDDSSEQIYPW